MKNRKSYLSIILLVSTIYSQSITSNRDLSFEYVATIEDLDNQGFAISGDRMYTIYPGTNNYQDSASFFSIVDLTTLTVIGTSETLWGYPNKIDVFDQIVVVEGDMFFNVADDQIEYLGSNFIESAYWSATMDTYKKDNFLYRVIQSTGFGVYDMTDPLNPVTVHEHEYAVPDDYPYGIYADENYIYLCDVGVDKIYIHEMEEIIPSLDRSVIYIVIGWLRKKIYCIRPKTLFMILVILRILSRLLVTHTMEVLQMEKWK